MSARDSSRCAPHENDADPGGSYGDPPAGTIHWVTNVGSGNGTELATAPSSKAMSQLVDGLGPNGKLIVVGVAAEPIEVTPLQLISGSRSLQGWASGTAADIEDTLAFAELSGVRPMIETYPLEQAAEAYAPMLSGKAEFRVVLTMSH